MSSVFEIKEHTLECQHIREYPRATANSQEEVLYLAIKQYTPLDNPNPKEGDVTIIGAHANGFPKVLSISKSYQTTRTHETRNYTSLFGKISTLALKTLASESAASGSQTYRTKAKAEFLMRHS